MLFRNEWGELYSTYNKESVMNNPDVEPPILQVCQSLGQYYACLLECDNMGNYTQSDNRGNFHNFKKEAVKDMIDWAKLDNLSYYTDRGLQLRVDDYKRMFNIINQDIDDDEYPCDKEFDKADYINDQLYTSLGTFHIINNTNLDSTQITI